MAISIGTVTNFAQSSNVNSASFSHTVAAGTNTALIVAVIRPNANTNSELESVTWTASGQPAQPLVSVSILGTNVAPQYYCHFFYLVAPTSGAGQVTVKYEGAVSVGTWGAKAINLTGVAQTDTIGVHIQGTTTTTQTLSASSLALIAGRRANTAITLGTGMSLVGTDWLVNPPTNTIYASVQSRLATTETTYTTGFGNATSGNGFAMVEVKAAGVVAATNPVPGTTYQKHYDITATPLTVHNWEHVVPAGNDRAIIVHCNPGAGATVQSVTYTVSGGSAQTFTPTTSSANTELFYLTGPVVGTGQIVVTLAAPGSGYFGAVSQNWTRVRSSSPIGASKAFTASIATPTTTITTISANSTVAVYATRQPASGTRAPTTGMSANYSISVADGLASIQRATDVIFTYTVGWNEEIYDTVALEIRPTGGGSTHESGLITIEGVGSTSVFVEGGEAGSPQPGGLTQRHYPAIASEFVVSEADGVGKTVGPGQSLTSISFNHTVSGADPLLIVYVQWVDPNPSVTYGGVAMVPIISGPPGAGEYAHLFYLKNPTPGTAAVTFTPSVGTGNYGGIVAQNWTGTDPLAPIGASVRHNGSVSTAAATTTFVNSTIAGYAVPTPAPPTARGADPATSTFNFSFPGTGNTVGNGIVSVYRNVSPTGSYQVGWNGETEEILFVEIKSVIDVPQKVTGPFTINAIGNTGVLTAGGKGRFKRALWYWTTVMKSPEAQVGEPGPNTVFKSTLEHNRLINECLASGITDLYIYIAYSATNPNRNWLGNTTWKNTFKAFVSACKIRGISVWAMDGWRGYFSDNLPNATRGPGGSAGPPLLYSVLQSYINYNASVTEDERLYGFHSDMEPQDGQGSTVTEPAEGQLVRFWNKDKFHPNNPAVDMPYSQLSQTQKDDRDWLMADWVGIHRELYNRCVAGGLKYGAALPSWPDDYLGEPVEATYDWGDGLGPVRRPVYEHIMRTGIHEYVVMTYNTNPANAAGRVLTVAGSSVPGELNYADTLGGKVTVFTSVETHFPVDQVDPVSYGDSTTKNNKTAVLNDINTQISILSSHPAFGGVMIHDWGDPDLDVKGEKGWRLMEPPSNNTATPPLPSDPVVFAEKVTITAMGQTLVVPTGGTTPTGQKLFRKGLWYWTKPQNASSPAQYRDGRDGYPQTNTILTSEPEQHRVLRELIEGDYTEIFIYVRYDPNATSLKNWYGNATIRANLARFIRKCRDWGIDVWAMEGWRGYFSDNSPGAARGPGGDAGPANLYATVDAMVAWNAPGRPENEKFVGFHSDMEPQDGQGEGEVVKFWNGFDYNHASMATASPHGGTRRDDRDWLMNDWVNITRTIYNKMVAAGLKFGAAMPNWMDDVGTYSNNYFNGTVYATYNWGQGNERLPVMHHMMRLAGMDYCIMSYNTSTARIIQMVSAEMAYAATLPANVRPNVYAAIETHIRVQAPPRVAGAGLPQFAAHPSTSGLAVGYRYANTSEGTTIDNYAQYVWTGFHWILASADGDLPITNPTAEVVSYGDTWFRTDRKDNKADIEADLLTIHNALLAAFPTSYKGVHVHDWPGGIDEMDPISTNTTDPGVPATQTGDIHTTGTFLVNAIGATNVVIPRTTAHVTGQFSINGFGATDVRYYMPVIGIPDFIPQFTISALGATSVNERTTGTLKVLITSTGITNVRTVRPGEETPRGRQTDLDFGTRIMLFEFDFTVLPGGLSVWRVTPNAGNVTFNGNVYTAVPIQVENLEWASEGAPPRPTLSIGDQDKVLLAQVQAWQDLVGVPVSVILTEARFLDNGSVGVKDKGIYIKKDIWNINRKVLANGYMLELELAAPFDQQNRQFPGRLMTRRDFPGLGRTKPR